MALDKQRQVPEDLPRLRLALEEGLSNDYPNCILLVESGLSYRLGIFFEHQNGD
jgi:hypothetical protein